MRTFRGSDGREWEVVVGRESWGSLFAIFLPRNGEGDPRQTLLRGTSMDEALRAVLEMEEAELVSLLDQSSPKTMD